MEQYQNPTLKEIQKALNMYLRKNKGAASDFNLMKDVVERYCDSKEEEIAIQQPVPLYLGLMGTMIGIIVGIGFIAINGGLSSEVLMENITSLMICVAIAMSASLLGIFFTTVLSWKSKSTTTKVEADKNHFYSWMQSELLPVLSGSTANALFLLQQNLTTFNSTFQSNIEGLNQSLSKVGETSKEQSQLISLIKDIDVSRVAKANVTVLKELRECTGEISVFNTYLHSVSDYLKAVNNLSNNLNQHLDRTAAIERMGQFFEQEIKQVSDREKYIHKVVADVDNTLRESFKQVKESTTSVVNHISNSSIKEYDMLKKHYEEQREKFGKMLQEQQESFISKSAEMTTLLDELKKLSDVKEAISQMIETSKSQTHAINKLSTAISEISIGEQTHSVIVKETTTSSKTSFFPKSISAMIAAILFLLTIALGIVIYNSFFSKTYFPSNDETSVKTEKIQTYTSFTNI